MAIFRFFPVLCALAPNAVALEEAPGPPADKFGPGDGYAKERLEPVMPKPLYRRAPAAPQHTMPGVEHYKTTFNRSREVELRAGCRLVSHGCKVASSDPKPQEELQLITDGDRSGEPGYDVELAGGKQWVQLDLGESYQLHCIWIWRFHRMPVVFRGVKVEVADDPAGRWTSVYNTQASEFGGVPDPLHEEIFTGFPIIIHRPVTARYVRLWSEGSDKLPGNHYIEVSVYGRLPGEPLADFFRPSGRVKLEAELPRQLFTYPPLPSPPAFKNVESSEVTWMRKDNVFIGSGCRLLSHHCPVTASDPSPIGDPASVTDGVRSSEDATMLDMAPGKQWVLIDLCASREVHCVWLWLNHRRAQVAYHDVVVQISDNPVYAGAAEGTIVLNNDPDDTAGFGKGTDKEWEETIYGRAITFPPVKGRYIRVWSNGNTLDNTNVFTEVAVYGKDVPASQKPEQQDRPPNPDNIDLVREIRQLIGKTSTETEAAQMKAFTGTIPRADNAAYAMVPIPGGEFLMGSPISEKHRRADEGPQVKVKVDPFWMGAHEVTWDQYMPFMAAPQPRWKDGAPKGEPGGTMVDAVSGPTSPYTDMTFGMGGKGYPAICMTEHSALKFCEWLSAQTGHFYRLPTEAEWEYAARAGTTTAWFWGDDPKMLAEYGWFSDNSAVENLTTTHPVGKKKPNPWGLYDIYGNVAEWTMDQNAPDWYAKLTAQQDRANPFNKPVLRYPRTVRGGSYDSEFNECRSASRRGSKAEWKVMDPQLPKSLWYHTNAQFVGFRIVRPLKLPDAEVMHEIWNLGVAGEDR